MLGEEDDDFENENVEKTPEPKSVENEHQENKQQPLVSEIVAEEVKDTEAEQEEIYEPVNANTEEAEVKEEEPERSPTPDPLRAIAAQLHSQLQGYKEDLNKFSNIMEENMPEPVVEETVTLVQVEAQEPKLVTEEEKRIVKNMSTEEAWSHVMGSVVKVK